MPNRLPALSSLVVSSALVLPGCVHRDDVTTHQNSIKQKVAQAMEENRVPVIPPDVWSSPDGDIPLDTMVFVNIDDPDHPGKIRQVSVRFASDEKVLYFDEKPFALYSVGRVRLRCQVTHVTKKEQIITITGKALIGSGSSTWSPDQMKDICTRILDPNFAKYEFPLETSIGSQTGRVVPVHDDTTDGLKKGSP